MSNDKFEDPLKYYLAYALEGQKSWISEGMKDLIPQSMSDAIFLAKKRNKEMEKDTNKSEIKIALGKIFENTNNKYNLLTDKAKRHLENFLTDKDSLSVEVSHQPKFLGGERFLFNKIACGAAFANLDNDIIPIFYVADYDKIHSELIKTKFSQSDSPNGFSISISPETEKKFLGKRIKDLPLPSVSYLLELFQEIRKKYSNSINSCLEDNWRKKLLEERLEEALRLIKIAHNNSENYTDWFINIIGTISNIIFDQGYLFISASDLEFKKLLTPFYETLLENQSKYVETYIDLQNQFRNNNIRSPLREIRRDFIPFFYECNNEECHCRRLELIGQDYTSMIHVKCECNECGNLIDFSLEKDNPDLSDHSAFFTPRVESRQYLVSKTIQPMIHIAGTGETRYYTMGIPLIRRFDKTITLPVIYFYNKITMNTFMTRKIEQDLIKLNIPDFLDNIKGLMKNLGKFNKLLNKPKDYVQDQAKIIELLTNFKSYMTQLDSILVNFQGTDMTPEDKNTVSSYLSNMFGKISKEKSGQETVFHWVDLSLKNGLSNFFKDYLQIYKPWLPPGMEIFL
ncbi:MAG: bacillithiol biosynthesis BshC [Candidatus Lokiarchaeota archaeon]|nr:bacillithiol biosynthesis BshC [Candidatus Lokiarchaeota archaeon]